MKILETEFNLHDVVKRGRADGRGLEWLIFSAISNAVLLLFHQLTENRSRKFYVAFSDVKCEILKFSFPFREYTVYAGHTIYQKSIKNMLFIWKRR